MLSITECVRKLREGRKAEIKARIIQSFYDEVLSNAQISRVDGTINVQFKEKDFDLALEATKELLENDFDFKRYVTLDDRFLDDKEITLEFNLEQSFKVVDSEPKVCNNGYAEDDIPF
jgi:hypothetical protein